jgi:hypothetical protein
VEAKWGRHSCLLFMVVDGAELRLARIEWVRTFNLLSRPLFGTTPLDGGAGSRAGKLVFLAPPASPVGQQKQLRLSHLG